MMKHKLVISAPFGNYVKLNGAYATIGTFTLNTRPGRWRQVIRTVRHANGGWINQLGLRNVGLVHGVAGRAIDSRNTIISIHGFAPDDWMQLFTTAANLLAKDQIIEMNCSCPNVSDFILNYSEIFNYAKTKLTPDQYDSLIVKIPPLNFMGLVDKAVDAGIRYFHCCNSYPTPIGGVSGRPLKPHSLQAIYDISKKWGAVAHIIGGGGIQSMKDIDDYRTAGAEMFAIGSGLFNPLVWPRLKSIVTQVNK